jgi:hypothetical protein
MRGLFGLFKKRWVRHRFTPAECAAGNRSRVRDVYREVRAIVASSQSARQQPPMP